MRKLILLLTFLLSGCGTIPFEFVKAKNADEVRDARNCGKDVLPNYGCWRSISLNAGCKVIAVWPRDSGDTDNLRTLGLEVWKCVENNKEY